MIIATCRWSAHRLQDLLPKTEDGVLILAYHLIQGGTDAPVDISLEMFQEQMKQLQEQTMVCSLEEALKKLRQEDPCKGPIVVVTFDDAYENFYTTAWPVLQELRIPCTLYVPVDFIEGNIPAPIRGSNGLKPCSWSQLLEMHASGLLTIGSHSCSHIDLRKADRNLAEYELVNSRRQLEEKTGTTVDSFCYPKGLWSTRVEKIVRETYQTAVIGGGRKIRSSRWDPYRLHRTPIRRDMSVSLHPVLTSSVWIEEWIADGVRSW